MSRAQGVHGSGSRSYTPQQREAVVTALLNAAPSGPVTVQELSRATGVGGRPVRAIVSEADGADFLLGGDSRGGYLVVDPGPASARLDARLASQIRQMARRLARRRRFRPEGL